MKYIVGEISKPDQDKIFSDLADDFRKTRWLQMRGGYFNDGVPIKWAIDRENDTYLFYAPQVSMSDEDKYYFYFEKVMYDLHVKTRDRETIYFAEEFNMKPVKLEKLKSAIKAAFAEYGTYAGWNALFTPHKFGDMAGL